MHFDPEGIVSCNTSTGVWTQHLFQVPLHSSDIELAESGGQDVIVRARLCDTHVYLCVICIFYFIEEIEESTFIGLNRTKVYL
jgi:hypothetical protein